jgi:uncharacterized protein YukE
MAAMLGADPDRLDDLARRMRDAAAQLQRIERQLTRLVNAQVWVGPAADRYRQEWNSRHRASLSRAATALAHNDRRLHANAEQQRRASAADRGGARSVAGRNRRNGPGRVGWLDQWKDRLGAFPGLGLLVSGATVVSASLTKYWGKAIGLRQLSKQNLERFARAIKRVPKPLRVLGKMFDGLTIVTSGHEAIKAILAGDADTAVRRVIDVGWVVGSRVPIVFAVKTAWDAGYAIGGEIDRRSGASDYWSDRIVESTVRREYGASLDPREAAEYSKRYDGPSGFARFLGDWVSS